RAHLPLREEVEQTRHRLASRRRGAWVLDVRRHEEEPPQPLDVERQRERAAHRFAAASRSACTNGRCSARTLKRSSTNARPRTLISARISGSPRRRSTASTHSSSAVAWKPRTPCSTIAALAPTGDTTGTAPLAMYASAL